MIGRTEHNALKPGNIDKFLTKGIEVFVKRRIQLYIIVGGRIRKEGFLDKGAPIEVINLSYLKGGVGYQGQQQLIKIRNKDTNEISYMDFDDTKYLKIKDNRPHISNRRKPGRY